MRSRRKRKTHTKAEHEGIRTRLSEEAFFALRDAAKGKAGPERANMARRLVFLGIWTWNPPPLAIDGTTYRIAMARGAPFRWYTIYLPKHHAGWIRSIAQRGYTEGWLISKLIVEGASALLRMEAAQKEERRLLHGR